jgi:hypothetical protein
MSSKFLQIATPTTAQPPRAAKATRAPPDPGEKSPGNTATDTTGNRTTRENPSADLIPADTGTTSSSNGATRTWTISSRRSLRRRARGPSDGARTQRRSISTITENRARGPSSDLGNSDYRMIIHREKKPVGIKAAERGKILLRISICRGRRSR